MTTKGGLTPQQVLNYRKNDEILQQTKETQSATLASLDRAKKHVHQADKEADSALHNLAEQREKMIDIIKQTDAIHNKLEISDQLVDQIGFGFNIPKLSQLTESRKKALIETVGVYEQQEYSFFSKSWSSVTYVSSQDPAQNLNDVFDPYLTMTDGTRFWIIDMSYGSIDGEGYTYGSSFSDIEKRNGTSSMKGYRLSCVRRRIWKRNNDPKLSKHHEILMRRVFDQHHQQQHPESNHQESVRANDISLLLNGTSHIHNDMTEDHKEQLKEIHKTDQKIDEGVKEIEQGIERLHTKAQQAHGELKLQEELVQRMDENVDQDLEQITAVNKKLSHKVDHQCACILS